VVVSVARLISTQTNEGNKEILALEDEEIGPISARRQPKFWEISRVVPNNRGEVIFT
jgi:hypothetical protein